jgi:hypothetical protein
MGLIAQIAQIGQEIQIIKTVTIVVWIIVVIAIAIACGVLARDKNRSVEKWFVLGLIGGFISLVTIAGLTVLNISKASDKGYDLSKLNKNAE